MRVLQFSASPVTWCNPQVVLGCVKTAQTWCDRYIAEDPFLSGTIFQLTVQQEEEVDNDEAERRELALSKEPSEALDQSDTYFTGEIELSEDEEEEEENERERRALQWDSDSDDDEKKEQ